MEKEEFLKKELKGDYLGGFDAVATAWDILVDEQIATEDELMLITDICGYNIDSLNSVLYARTGYNAFYQYFDVEEEEEEEEEV